ncbi:hypothetical protein [Hymenobacter sp. BRD67]|nr:hypothetical protein [Hymenobacter sp. BRD67]
MQRILRRLSAYSLFALAAVLALPHTSYAQLGISRPGASRYSMALW